MFQRSEKLNIDMIVGTDHEAHLEDWNYLSSVGRGNVILKDFVKLYLHLETSEVGV